MLHYSNLNYAQYKPELADSHHGDENLEVDILVGSDQYYQLVTGEVIHQRDGLTAIHTS